MDGWETRRRREPGDDWCIVRLGVPGVVRGVVVDTAFFTGNHPESCSLEGCAVAGHPSPEELADPRRAWTELVARSPIEGGSENAFATAAAVRVTHLRLRIYPDGGVARLRVHGEAVPDVRRLTVGGVLPVDLAAVANGGAVVDCSDMYFSSRHHLTMPGPARTMGEGWETRRRRGPGHDWAVVRLLAAGVVQRVEVDTSHFKGNAPEACSLDWRQGDDGPWGRLLGRTRLQPHTRHHFDVDDAPPATHVRLNIYPDGGVARLRLHGRVDPVGYTAAALRWLNVLPEADAVAELLACCASRRWAAAMAARRPYADLPALERVADEVWAGVTPDDWLEGFAAHPRIGERGPVGRWSAQEQAGATSAGDHTLTALAQANRAYEQRFGRVYVVCATGTSGEQLLEILRGRLTNDPDTELRVAAEEQRKITRLRLRKLLEPAR
jgi:allantoicase